MPKLLLQLPEVEQSFTRPVVVEITKQILEMTGLPKDTPIRFPGDTEDIAQPGTMLEGEQYDQNYFENNRRVVVAIEEKYQEGIALTQTVLQRDNRLVYRDDDLGVYIKPVYISTELTINFIMRLRDKSEAVRWRNDVRNRVSLMRDVRIHDFDYHYLLPVEAEAILKEVHRLRESNQGYGEDFETWYTKCVTARATTVSDLAGKNARRAFTEKQMRCMGWFDWVEGSEKEDKSNDSESRDVSFSYRVNYERPTGIVLGYPFVIHNQVISSEFSRQEVSDEVEKHAKSFSLYGTLYNYFEKKDQTQDTIYDQGLRLPAWDDFLPPTILPNMRPVITALTTVDDDGKMLLDLNELGEWGISPMILKFIKESEAPFITKYRKSVLNISLYRKDTLGGDDWIECTSEGIVQAYRPLNQRNHYHLMLTVCTDWTILDKDAIERLRDWPEVVVLLMYSIGRVVTADTLNGLLIPRDEMDRLVDISSGAGYKQGEYDVYKTTPYVNTSPTDDNRYPQTATSGIVPFDPNIPVVGAIKHRGDKCLMKTVQSWGIVGRLSRQ